MINVIHKLLSSTVINTHSDPPTHTVPPEQDPTSIIVVGVLF